MFARNSGSGGSGNGRPVCKFFLEGRCKFGESCKNEHPRGQQQQNQTTNRFAAFGSGGGSVGDKYRPNDNRPLPFQLDRDNIRRDVTTGGTDGEKPTWPLSAYGPGRDAPLELIDAEFEKSPEELRVLYYIAKASHDPQTLQEYERGEAALVNGANAKAQYVLNNLDSAIQYVLGGENTDKDRNKQTKANANPWQRPGTTAISSGSAGNSFGVQSGPQTTSSGFAAFGQPSLPATSAFGQPSMPGGSGAAAGKPAFGAPSMPGAQNTAFGTSAGIRPAFGAPSSFVTSAQTQGPTFGASSVAGAQPSPFAAGTQTALQQSNRFGSTPGFGGTTPQPSAFGQPSQSSSSTGGGFGQASQAPSNSFGQASQQGTVGGFGQASKLGGSGGFGQSALTGAGVNPMATVPQQNASPFGQASSSKPQGSVSAGFGAPSRVGANSPFGAQPQPSGSAFGTAPSPPTSGGPQRQVGGTRDPSDTTRDASGKLLRWQGYTVKYDSEGAPLYQNPSTGKAERIWIENGPPPSHPDFEGRPEAYEGEKGQMLKQMYDYLAETGSFRDGLIPEVPPKREWLRWDL